MILNKRRLYLKMNSKRARYSTPNVNTRGADLLAMKKAKTKTLNPSKIKMNKTMSFRKDLSFLFLLSTSLLLRSPKGRPQQKALE